MYYPAFKRFRLQDLLLSIIKSAFELWLSNALKWITDKAITIGIGAVMGILIEELFNSHS